MSKGAKVCPKCLYRKPIKDFAKSSYTKDGLQSMCRECWKLINKKLRIKPNPDANPNYDEFNGKITLVDGWPTVVGKLTPEEEDKLRRKWKMTPYNEKTLTTEQFNEIWSKYTNELSKKLTGTGTGKRGKYEKKKGGKLQRQLEQEKYINELENG